MTIKITYLKNSNSYNKKNKGSPLRKSLITILKRDLKNIKNKKVLEIGCGTWDFAKNILEKNNCQWYGFEPVDMKEKNITLVKGSVEKIPYHNNSFDLILCNQTIEHWFEYNVSLKKALNEIHRVLKPKGILMINAPIHLHGDPRFVMGEMKKIKSLFNNKLWKIKLFEKVMPNEKRKDWKRIGTSGILSKFGYPDFMIPNHKSASTYLLNIHTEKKSKSIKQQQNKNERQKLLIIIRFIKTYIKTRLF